MRKQQTFFIFFLLILPSMSFLNVEIKARCTAPGRVRSYLSEKGAEFRGKDNQTDTYFNVATGRLKLREGNIENNLIYYERMDQLTAKNSRFMLVKVDDAQGLKDVLSKSIGIKIVVQKNREIYFIDNVKFHIDEVPGLGSFVEIEASNLNSDLPEEKLKEQCEFYQQQLGILPEDLLQLSYSDMMLK